MNDFHKNLKSIKESISNIQDTNCQKIWDEAQNAAVAAINSGELSYIGTRPFSHVLETVSGHVTIENVDHPFVNFLSNIGVGEMVNFHNESWYLIINKEFIPQQSNLTIDDIFEGSGAFANILRKHGVIAMGPSDKDFKYDISKRELYAKIQANNQNNG